MSRYQLQPLPEYEGVYEIAVGWDPPLNTFFAQVLHLDDDMADEHGEVLWIGGMPTEIHDHGKVIDAVRPYAVIPPDLAFKLYGDAN